MATCMTTAVLRTPSHYWRSSDSESRDFSDCRFFTHFIPEDTAGGLYCGKLPIVKDEEVESGGKYEDD